MRLRAENVRNGRSNCSGAVDGILVAEGLTYVDLLRPGAEDAYALRSVQKLRMVTVQGTLVASQKAEEWRWRANANVAIDGNATFAWGKVAHLPFTLRKLSWDDLESSGGVLIVDEYLKVARWKKATCISLFQASTQSPIRRNKLYWWFGTCLFFHILGIFIPTDFHIFQRGWNHQPDNILFILVDPLSKSGRTGRWSVAQADVFPSQRGWRSYSWLIWTEVNHGNLT